MKYIDADKLIAEVERQKKELFKIGGDTFENKWACGSLDSIKAFVISLQQKQPKLPGYDEALLEVKSKVDELYEETSIGLSEYDSGLYNGIAETCMKLRGFIKARMDSEEQPEEEPTEFEKKLWEVLKSEGSPIGPIEKFTNADKEAFHSYAAGLLALAREQFIKDGFVIEKKAFHNAVEKVSPEVMKGVSEHMALSSFISNLGSRYPEVSFAKMARIAKAAYNFGKAEALKDLSGWSKNALTRGCAAIDISGLTGADYIRREGKLLSISDLEKLPGFKED